MSQVRIAHLKDPADPSATPGLIKIEVNGQEVPLPPKGQDKVVRVERVEFHVHTEPNKDGEEI